MCALKSYAKNNSKIAYNVEGEIQKMKKLTVTVDAQSHNLKSSAHLL
jgi:hypothetical protein